MNKRYYEHTLPIIRGSLSNTYNLIDCLLCSKENSIFAKYDILLLVLKAV